LTSGTVEVRTPTKALANSLDTGEGGIDRKVELFKRGGKEITRTGLLD